MINLSIDGKEIQVPEGTTVLRAAQKAGIDIPTLCDHPELTPYGGCRLCIVEVEGARTLQPSCTLPVIQNMVVQTNTDRVKEARKFILTMIFSERNHFCPYCQVSGGDCELQNAAYAEDMTHWPIQPNWEPFQVDASHPYFILDQNRCILCRRCVRACSELVGNHTLGFEERGAKSLLIADLGVPLGESSCISCGTCVQVCPTGALIDRESAYQGKEVQVDHNKTICFGCSLGCGIDVLTRDNRMIRIEGDWEAPVNSGIICEVGRYLPGVDTRDRILTPLMREDGKQKAITWDKALEKFSRTVKDSSNKDGSNNVAIASTRLSAEDLYSFKSIFKDEIKFNTVTTTEAGLSTKAISEFADEHGSPYESELDQIYKSDCVILIDSGLDKDHEVAGFFVKRHLSDGCKLITIDTCETTFHGVAQHAIKIDAKNLGKLFTTLASNPMTVDEISKLGINKDEAQSIIKLINSSEHPFIIFGGSVAADDTTFTSMVEFAKYVGIIKNDQWNLICVKGGANSLAASQYRLDAAINGSSFDLGVVILGDEEPSERLLKSLENTQYLVVFASHYSKLTAKADLVLPVLMWTENEGYYLSLEGKLQKLTKSIDEPENVKSISFIFNDYSKRSKINIAINEWKSSLLERTSPIVIAE